MELDNSVPVQIAIMEKETGAVVDHDQFDSKEEAVRWGDEKIRNKPWKYQITEVMKD